MAKDQNNSEYILNAIADGVFTVDPEWNITFFNNSAEIITGTKKTEAIGRKCFEVFRANICQSTCALRETIKSGKKIIDLPVNILNNKGQIIPISVSTSVLRDKGGNIIGGAETFRDLSIIELLKKELTSKYTYADIISKNHLIQDIIQILPDIAKSGSTVLIEGPSGSGKELFAKAIHNLSNRKGALIAMNCGALPDTLLESELFGYVKGAFSDAKQDKPGRFKLAEKGTIFFDEIGDISQALQLKLLRVLQEKEYEALGSTTTSKTDVRVIAATNKNLSDLVAKGDFREDLFYRLNVVKLELPPLSRRKEDIPFLVEHFILKFNALKGRNIRNISGHAMDMLMEYDFPGNIRELENIIEYAFILCFEKQIMSQHFPKEFLNNVKLKNTDEIPINSIIHQSEAKTILEILQKYNGNRVKTASHLGIDKTTLWRKMKKLGITFP
ncbi:MAG: sigma 54-interacting transcriptional regulator [Nitrospirae bacterium]|nr:sigma 54-interacting transcriptional regulator [Nitrospirota bacterium]